MIGEELKILFKKDMAYLTTNSPMSFEQLGLPDIVKSFKSAAYWTIRVLKYSEVDKIIICEIVSYHIGVTKFGYNQKQLADKLNDLQTVKFRSINTIALLKTLGGTTPISIVPAKHVPVDKPQKHYHSEIFRKKPTKVIIKETFFVPLKKVRFVHGGVSFNKKFREYNKTLELTIPNSEIREEFDAVKNYFANVLLTKKIEVKVNIAIIDNKITTTEINSSEIDKINKKFIADVKLVFVKSTIKKKNNIEIDKNLFTMDEYFDTFTEEIIKSNTFYNNDRELFEDLLTISNTKHYKHLRFLSSKHSHDIMKLRFVLRPFSFIFLIQGDRNYHIVWETLDTEEATYIWHIDKNLQILKMTVQKIEEIINLIKNQGKIAYISSTQDPFRRIYHDYSEPVLGFVKWKEEIKNILK